MAKKIFTDESLNTLVSEIKSYTDTKTSGMVTANPTLDGTESKLTGLQVGDTKYAVGDVGELTIEASQLLSTTEIQLTEAQVEVLKKYAIVTVKVPSYNLETTVYKYNQVEEGLVFINSTYVNSESSVDQTLYIVEYSTNILTITERTSGGIIANYENNTLYVSGQGDMKMLPPISSSNAGDVVVVNDSRTGYTVRPKVKNREINLRFVSQSGYTITNEIVRVQLANWYHTFASEETLVGVTNSGIMCVKVLRCDPNRYISLTLPDGSTMGFHNGHEAVIDISEANTDDLIFTVRPVNVDRRNEWLALPYATTDDNGKIPVVNSDGLYELQEPAKELPEVTADDAGKIPVVMPSGDWAVVSDIQDFGVQRLFVGQNTEICGDDSDNFSINHYQQMTGEEPINTISMTQDGGATISSESNINIAAMNELVLTGGDRFNIVGGADDDSSINADATGIQMTSAGGVSVSGTTGVDIAAGENDESHFYMEGTLIEIEQSDNSGNYSGVSVESSYCAMGHTTATGDTNQIFIDANGIDLSADGQIQFNGDSTFVGDVDFTNANVIGLSNKTEFGTVFSDTSTPLTDEDISIFESYLESGDITPLTQIVFEADGYASGQYEAFLADTFYDFEALTFTLIYKSPSHTLYITCPTNDTSACTGYWAYSEKETVDTSNLVGKAVEGETVTIESESVTAGVGAEIFNDYRERTYNSSNELSTGNIATGNYSHAEGSGTIASGKYSHAEGNVTIASAESSHAEGYLTKASRICSHAEGASTTASGIGSHAEGNNTIASGAYSHAEGNNTIASGAYSHASGHSTTALDFQFVVGKYNNTDIAGANGVSLVDSQSADETLFVVGYGTSEAAGNAFRISANGKCRGVSTFTASGADFAELFEWEDGNPNNEDRRGLFVALEGEKIKLANNGDDFIGVISGDEAFLGNSASEEWQGKYLTDVFGTRLTQTIEIPEKIDDATGKIITPAHTVTQYVLNPDYNPNEKYIMRENRKEWGTVGLLGQIVVIDDGTSVVGGYTKPSLNGVGTASNSGYRVIKRIDETHIKVLVK